MFRSLGAVVAEALRRRYRASEVLYFAGSWAGPVASRQGRTTARLCYRSPADLSDERWLAASIFTSRAVVPNFFWHVAPC